jgi:hypothetical protein
MRHILGESLYKKMLVGITTIIISAGGLKFATAAKSVEAVAPCIITISGIQYDVAPLTVPGVHPGGNIFVCGTNMTAVFMSMPTHAADIARMTPYIYVPPTATPTPTAIPSVSPSPIPSTTPAPSITPSPNPIPSTTPIPSPSVSPTPHHEDEINEIEIEDAHETTHENVKENHTQESNHGQEVRAVARKNEGTEHDSD